MNREWTRNLLMILAATAIGCTPPRITAFRLSPGPREKDGIPFYLPKPYLVVTKNFRHVPTPTVGLTRPVAVPDQFDANARELQIAATLTQTRALNLERKIQEQFNREDKTTTTVTIGQANTQPVDNDSGGGESESEPNEAPTGGRATDSADQDKKAKDESSEPAPSPSPPAEFAGVMAGSGQVLGPTHIDVTPSGSLPDGLVPETFYTYQVLYLPDLTQKYGLRVNSGTGEFRATMNLVNGWMNTGAGPIYMKDSTQAANTVAAGMAVSDVIDSVAGLGLARGSPAAATGINPLGLLGLLGEQQRVSGERVAGMKAGAALAKMEFDKKFAQIYIFELVLDSDKGTTSWQLMPKMPIDMSREYIAGATQSN